MKTANIERAEAKLREADQWRARFLQGVHEVRMLKVRMRTYARILSEAAHQGVPGGPLTRLWKIERWLHDQRLIVLQNMRSSLDCASASDHAARILYAHDEGWNVL